MPEFDKRKGIDEENWSSSHTDAFSHCLLFVSWSVRLRAMQCGEYILKESRVNISNALTMSLPADLGLGGVERNVALTIFFIPYILFEIPSNILMKRFRPNVWRRYFPPVITAYRLFYSSSRMYINFWHRHGFPRVWWGIQLAYMTHC